MSSRDFPGNPSFRDALGAVGFKCRRSSECREQLQLFAHDGNAGSLPREVLEPKARIRPKPESKLLKNNDLFWTRRALIRARLGPSIAKYISASAIPPTAGIARCSVGQIGHDPCQGWDSRDAKPGFERYQH
jgi:hypothetical protein